VGHGEAGSFEDLAGGHGMVRPADGAFEFGQILLGLVTGEAILPDPIVVDLGLTGLANDLGLSGSSKSAILVEFTVVKQ
jgi:hypothetical protein